MSSAPEPTLFDKFKKTTGQLETDDDEARFDERIKKLIRHRPVPEKPE